MMDGRINWHPMILRTQLQPVHALQAWKNAQAYQISGAKGAMAQGGLPHPKQPPRRPSEIFYSPPPRGGFLFRWDSLNTVITH